MFKSDFPIFGTHPGLAYLDSAASAQKPGVVINKVAWVYSHAYANIHRGTYDLSEDLTREYEAARENIRSFINAKSAKEIIFTKGATEAINLVAASFLEPGDKVTLSAAEHHSNIVPYQLKGCRLSVIDINDDGSLRFSGIENGTKLVAITHVSNVLGIIYPVGEIIKAAHAVGAKVLIDGSQAIAHLPIDVQDLDADFYVFSGHKMYGPSGIGVLYGKSEVLSAMRPYQGGGDMIKEVSFEGTTYADIPARFEAGTPSIAEAIGLSEAANYMRSCDDIASDKLLEYMTAELAKVPGMRMFGTAAPKTGLQTFILDGIHPQDAAFVLNKEKVAVRIGHHCAMPLHKRLGVDSTIRASLGVYNTPEDVDKLVKGLIKTRSFF